MSLPLLSSITSCPHLSCFQLKGAQTGADQLRQNPEAIEFCFQVRKAFKTAHRDTPEDKLPAPFAEVHKLLFQPIFAARQAEQEDKKKKVSFLISFTISLAQLLAL